MRFEVPGVVTAVVEDRRVRKTKAALQQAMIELVIEQGYEAISIDAIASRADVTRATFYAHYPSKAALLTAVVDAFADDVIAALGEDEAADHPAGRLQVLLVQAREYRDVLGIIVRGEGDGGPLRRFTERVEEVIAADLTVKLRAERWRASPRPDAHHEAARRPGRRRGRRGSSSTTTAARRTSPRPSTPPTSAGWDWAAGLRPA